MATVATMMKDGKKKKSRRTNWFLFCFGLKNVVRKRHVPVVLKVTTEEGKKATTITLKPPPPPPRTIQHTCPVLLIKIIKFNVSCVHITTTHEQFLYRVFFENLYVRYKKKG